MQLRMRRPLIGDEVVGRTGSSQGVAVPPCPFIMDPLSNHSDGPVVPIAPVLARLAPCHPCGHDSAGGC